MLALLYVSADGVKKVDLLNFVIFVATNNGICIIYTIIKRKINNEALIVSTYYKVV